jgi:uncharacterized protein (DUF58 family)
VYDFIDSSMLARLASLPVDARVAMTGNMAGRHRSPHRGSSVEFAEYRKYVPGDDTRRLDWKAFARSDRFYIKEYEADTNLRAIFVVDASGSMDFQSDGESKFEFARRIAASLAYLLVNQGDAAGISVCAEKIQLEIPPSRRPAHLERIFSALDSIAPSGETGLADALHAIASKAPRRSFVVILSDLLTDTAPLSNALRHLQQQKHDVSVFHVMDPAEMHFDFERPHRFVDMENNHSIVAEPELIAEEYQIALDTFLKSVRLECAEARCDYRLVTTNTPVESLLREFLTARNLRTKH